MIKKEDITAVILAGGKSQRMGKDKAFLLHNNQSFLQRIIYAVEGLTSKTILISDNNLCHNFGVELVEDLVKNSGPVGGIYTAMNHVKTPYLLVLSCDIPKVNSELIAYLIQQSIDVELNILSVDKKVQPLTAIYKQSTLPIFENALALQALKLRLLFEQMTMNIIDCPIEFKSLLANINTPEEFENLIKNENRD